MRNKDLALDLLELGMAHRDEPGVLANILIALDRLSSARPDHATTHYASGRVLLLLGRRQLALGAFRTALVHLPGFALAHYYEGVTLWLLGHDSHALTKLEQARTLDPQLFEAHYDAGQLHAQRGDYRQALVLWEEALALRPDDFPTLKKVLQAQLALEQFEHARLTHQRLREVWRSSSEPRVRAVESYVIDQFVVGPLAIVAVETLAPSGDPQVLYSFAVRHDGKTIFTVLLESSVALRRTGYDWVLAVTDGRTRINTDGRYRDRPGYHVLRPDVVALIRRYSGLDGPDE